MDELRPVVELLRSVTDLDAPDLADLLGQLSTTATFDRSRIATTIEHEATELPVVRANGRIIGMATLVTSSYRRQGAGM